MRPYKMKGILVHALPFSCIEEAKENVSLLCRTFEFYSVKIPSINGSPPIEIDTSRMQEFIAKAFGYCDWATLTLILASEKPPSYIDMDICIDEIYENLSKRIASYINAEFLTENIQRAFSLAKFGCAPKVHSNADCYISYFQCKTLEQWKQLQVLQAAHTRATRYRRRMSPYESSMAQYWYDKAVAKVLGDKVPRKPRRRKEA
jgi:hypothetical protein